MCRSHDLTIECTVTPFTKGSRVKVQLQNKRFLDDQETTECIKTHIIRQYHILGLLLSDHHVDPIFFVWENYNRANTRMTGIYHDT